MGKKVLIALLQAVAQKDNETKASPLKVTVVSPSELSSFFVLTASSCLYSVPSVKVVDLVFIHHTVLVT